jgi:hypothetical protein
MDGLRRCFLAACGAAAAACTPTLDWREVRPEGGALLAMFPCRPDRHQREVSLAGERRRMNLLVCAAGGNTFALGYVDTPDAARAGAVMAELRTLAAEHIGVPTPTVAPYRLAGMTPNPQAAELRLQGKLPDGNEVRERAVFFAHGLRVYQASTIGRHLDEEAAQDFVSGLKLPS